MERIPNPTIDKFKNTTNTIFKNIIMETAKKALFAELPFLNLPVLKQITNFFFEYISKHLLKMINDEIAHLIINKQVGEQLNDYKDELDKLLKMENRNEYYNQDEINKQLEETKKRMRDLINFKSS